MKRFSHLTRRAAGLFLLSVLVLQVPLSTVFAIANQQTQQPSVEQALEEFFKRNDRGWTVRISNDRQRVTSLFGRRTKPYRGKPSENAFQFLRENSRLLGVNPELNDVRIVNERTSRFGANVELQQVFKNLPVENGRIQINFDSDGRVVQVVSSYAPIAGASEQTPIPKQQATETAINEFLRTTPLITSKRAEQQKSNQPQVNRNELQLSQPPKIDDVFFVRGERLRRAYKTLIDASRPFGVKEIVTDAATGEVLQIRNYVHNAVDGQGQVFIPNPVNSRNNNTIFDSGDNNSDVPNTNPNPYFTVPLLALDAPSGGPFTLKGPFVVLEDIEAPSNTPPSESSSNGFSYQRGPDNFEDVMIYFHIDRIQRYIQSLGFIDAMNRRVRVDAHGLNGADDSHYRGTPVGQGYIAFGDGGVDDAEDADVIAHEYGHALQDNQAPGKYNTGEQADAMGEGFGDYWAVSSYADETLASGHDMACVMEWDQVPGCLRRVDENVTTDDFVSGGDEHINGLIWSRTLFDIFNLLGKTTTDRLVLQSHFNVPDGPTFVQAADAIITADLQLFSGSHITTLCTVFMNRKIYGPTNCPTVPSSSGNQSTLVALARFNDAGLPASPLTGAQVTNIVTGINNYLNEVTYAQASLVQQTRGWLALPASRASYYDQTSSNMLVDLTQDVIDRIVADDPSFNFSNIDRMVILTNDDGSGGETRGQREWATTGPWPYTLPAAFGTKRMSVSVHRFDQIEAQLTHGMGHHFGLGDLYAHDGVTFPRPFADGWGNMAKTSAGAFNNTHVFGWDKLRPNWLASANLRFIPRPGDGVAFDETIPLFRQEAAAGGSNLMLLQVGTTRGIAATERIRERASYYIEARRKSGTYDNNIPTSGVIVYYVNEDISQGFGPLRIVDATPGDNDLTNAALSAGGSLSNIDATGLSVDVLAPTGSEEFRVRVRYDPPETAVDVSINPRDANWNSPDIWIDGPGCNSGNCGFDTDNGRTETDRGDNPRVGEVNRVYARVFNSGPGIAHNVRVDFWLSDPYHGIDGGGADPDTGGNVAFNKHFFTEIPTIAAGVSVPVFVPWTPASLPAGHSSPHSCVKVKIADVFNDTNDFNQVSQENIHEYDTTSGSPYKPVVNPFRVANPYDHPILVYLRADNVPVGWQTTIVPKKVFLPVGGSVDAEITIQAPETYPVCSTEHVTVSAWYPSGDTLIELGGATARVNLKTRTQLTLETKEESCNRDNPNRINFAHQVLACKTKLSSKGCTNPKRPFEHITLEYKGPDGKPVYHDIVTDANGCFEDFFVEPQPGIWTVQADYPGNHCAGTTRTDGNPVIVTGVPQGVDGLGRGPWFSFHLGMNFPLGKFNETFDPGPSATFDVEYPFRRNFSLVGLLGFHYFHGDGVPSTYYTNLSLNGKLYFPVGSWRGFINGGPGVYFPKTGPNKFGLNVGGGFQFQLNPKFVFEVGPDFHFVDPSGINRKFVDAKMGVAFRF